MGPATINVSLIDSRIEPREPPCVALGGIGRRSPRPVRLVRSNVNVTLIRDRYIPPFAAVARSKRLLQSLQSKFAATAARLPQSVKSDRYMHVASQQRPLHAARLPQSVKSDRYISPFTAVARTVARALAETRNLW